MPLHVSGTELLNSNGCQVRLVGVDCDGLEWQANGNIDDNGTTVSVLQEVEEAGEYWGANCVRVPLSQDFWNGTSNSKGNPGSAAAYQALVDAIVSECNTLGIYCDLDLHWSGTGSYGTATGQYSMPDDNSPAFWESVAARYANNPSVVFDLYNEPFPNTWQIWRWGGTTADNPSFTTPGLQALLGDIRGTAYGNSSGLGSSGDANNVCLAGGLAYSFDFADDQSGDSFPGLTDTASGNGVLYTDHIYDNKSVNAATPDTSSSPEGGSWSAGGGWSGTGGGWEYFVDPALAKGPVMIEEFGAMNSSGQDLNDGGAFIDTVLAFINGSNDKDYDYNALAWNMVPEVTPPLVSAWSATLGTPSAGGAWNLNNFEGTEVYAWLTSTAQPACSGSTPTDTPTDSPTVTPTGTPSRTSTPSSTPSLTASATPSLTLTPSRTATPTLTLTPSLTASDTPSVSPSATATPSATPSVSPSTSPSASPSPSRTGSPSATPTYSDSPTDSPSPNGTLTDSPTATPTATVSSTPSRSPSDTPSSTPSQSPSPSPTFSASLSPSESPSFSPSPTPSVSGSPTATVSASPTGSSSPTPGASPSASPSATETGSSTPSATATLTETGSPTPSATATLTESPGPDATATATETATTTATAPAGSPTPPGGPLVITKLYPAPNPWDPGQGPGSIAVDMAGPADSVTVRVFTKALVLVLQFTQGGLRPGWQSVSLPSDFSRLASGLYYVQAQAARGGARSSVATARFFVLR